MSVPAMACEVLASEAVPNLGAARPSLTANANPLNTPPATGTISVPFTPSGAVVTNTGRTVEAAQTYMATYLNKLNVGTTPGRPVLY